jgi:hypothetical protein
MSHVTANFCDSFEVDQVGSSGFYYILQMFWGDCNVCSTGFLKREPSSKFYIVKSLRSFKFPIWNSFFLLLF